MNREVKWTDSEGREVLALYHPGVGLEIVKVREPRDETDEYEDKTTHQAKPSESWGTPEAEEER